MASDAVLRQELLRDPCADRQLRIDVTRRDGDLVLRLHGEVDMTSVPVLRTCIDEHLGSVDGRVVLDLGGVTFLDSSGIATIVRTHHRLSAAGRCLVVVNPRSIVERVFDLADLAELVEERGQMPQDQ